MEHAGILVLDTILREGLLRIIFLNSALLVLLVEVESCKLLGLLLLPLLNGEGLLFRLFFDDGLLVLGNFSWSSLFLRSLRLLALVTLLAPVVLATSGAGVLTATSSPAAAGVFASAV